LREAFYLGERTAFVDPELTSRRIGTSRSAMRRFGLTFYTLALVALISAAYPVLTRGVNAGRMLAAQDDPVQLTDLGLDDRLDTERAAQEIDAALAANDPELADSFIELARERGIAVDPDRLAKVESANQAAASTASTARSFARGLFLGETDSIAAFGGTALGDLFVFGDLRDATRQGIQFARGETVDKTVLGLSLAGIAITAGTYASLGAAAPARLGLSAIKAGAKTGRIGAGFLRAARLERVENLARAAGDLGRVQSKAGGRAAIEGLKLAEQPKDLSRLAQLAAAKGGKTRAVLKLLGRGAIALTTGLFDLALWAFWAVAHLLGLCVTLKRMVERFTLWAIRRGKRRRERLLARARADSYRVRARLVAWSWLWGRRITTVRRNVAVAAADR
jgi:hypothetical protein